MVHDPIADMLIQIKNAGMSGKAGIELPFSRMKMEVAKILASEGFISTVAKAGEDPKATMKIELKYDGKQSAMTGVRRVSKPGLRWYVNKSSIPRVVGGLGMSIISTSKGIMTDKQAKKMGVGGELLCEIW